MSNAVALPMQDLQTMAKALADSGMFGFKTPQQALAIMLVAQSQGIPAAQACVDFDLIQGKPAMTARAMLARFQQAGGVINWIEYTDEVCEAEFSHPQCPRPVKIRWTLDDAKRAGLTMKDNWKKYPRQMLSSRVMSEGVDRCYPSASGGFYPPEVVQDFGRERDITPPETPRGGAKERLSREQQDKVDAVAATCQEHLDNGSADDAAVELDNAALDADEMVYFWDQFDAKAGKAIAKAGKALRDARKAAALPPAVPDPAPAADTITPAQHKRLEARIKELGADRDKLKAYVMKEYGIEHLNALTKEAYKAVDAMLDKKAAAAKSVQPVAPVEVSISDKIAACQTVEELDALAETFSEEDVGIYFDAVAKRKSELQEAAL